MSFHPILRFNGGAGSSTLPPEPPVGKCALFDRPRPCVVQWLGKDGRKHRQGRLVLAYGIEGQRFRALWSLGWDKPSGYTFDFWVEYCETAHLAKRQADVSLRTLDKALWEYSRQHATDALPRISKTEP